MRVEQIDNCHRTRPQIWPCHSILLYTYSWSVGEFPAPALLILFLLSFDSILLATFFFFRSSPAVTRAMDTHTRSAASILAHVIWLCVPLAMVDCWSVSVFVLRPDWWLSPWPSAAAAERRFFPFSRASILLTVEKKCPGCCTSKYRL